MNIFRLIADMLHLAAILTLLYRIWKSRNCIGKQLLSQTLTAGTLCPQIPVEVVQLLFKAAN